MPCREADDARHPGSRARDRTGRWRPRRAGSAFAAASIAALSLALAQASPAVAHEDPGQQILEISREIEQRPKDAGLYLRRAELHRSRREWSDGLADLQTAARLDPDLTVIDLSLAQLLLAADNPEPALVAVDRFLARHADNASGHLARARILGRLGRRLEAVGEFTRGIDLALGSEGRGAQPDDYLDRARLLVAEGDEHVGEAIRGLDEGAAALGGSIPLVLLAIDLELKKHNWDSALARLASVEARAARKEAWLARRGDVLVQAGRIEEARSAYAAALAAIDALPERLRTTSTTSALASRIRVALSTPTVSPASSEGSRLPGSTEPSDQRSPM